MTTPSENIIQLRELTKKICLENIDGEYRDIVLLLKNLVNENKKIIEDTRTNKDKIKCYESMCLRITNILNKVNIS